MCWPAQARFWPGADPLGAQTKHRNIFVDFKPELRNPWHRVCIASLGSRLRIILILIEWKIKMLFIPKTGFWITQSQLNITFNMWVKKNIKYSLTSLCNRWVKNDNLHPVLGKHRGLFPGSRVLLQESEFKFLISSFVTSFIWNISICQTLSSPEWFILKSIFNLFVA